MSARMTKMETTRTTLSRTEFMLRTLVMSVVLALSACVTINIYFPAAATEKAADKIIDEIWQAQPNASTTPTPENAPSTTKE